MATAKKAAKTAARKTPAQSAAAPWDRDNPKPGAHGHLSPKAKADAKARARKAGRPYPNLVDNMAAAKAQKG